MKPEHKWLKVARRGTLIAISACFVVALSGCFHDEDDLIPKLWDIAWFGTDTGDITVNVPVDDLNTLTSYNTTASTYTLNIVVAPPNIDITITDSASVFNLNMSGTIAADGQSASGSYTGTSDNNNPINGTWTVNKH